MARRRVDIAEGRRLQAAAAAYVAPGFRGDGSMALWSQASDHPVIVRHLDPENPIDAISVWVIQNLDDVLDELEAYRRGAR